jgi:hypothetical protein
MITANDILTRVWSLVNIDPVRTHGATGQKRAFKLMLDIQAASASWLAGRKPNLKDWRAAESAPPSCPGS